jgi:hypothetical protein
MVIQGGQKRDVRGRLYDVGDDEFLFSIKPNPSLLQNINIAFHPDQWPFAGIPSATPRRGYGGQVARS